MLMILVLKILRKTLNRLLQYHHGVQLDLCILGALPPIQHFSDDICPAVRQNQLLRPSSLLHWSRMIYFWLLSGPTPESFPVSPILYPLMPSLLEFLKAWDIGKFVYQITMLQWSDCLLFLQYGLHVNSVKILPHAVVWIHWLPRYTQILIWNHSSFHGSLHASYSCMSCKAWREPWVFPIAFEHSQWFLWTPCPQG